MLNSDKVRSSRNKTLTLGQEEEQAFARQLQRLEQGMSLPQITDQIFHDDLLRAADLFPRQFVDLLILDPPYNLDKDFHGLKFSKSRDHNYRAYLESWFPKLLPLLKPEATVYFCGDWRNCAEIYTLLTKYLKVRNRITWQREKGRGANANWKNSTEDIWFATLSENYYFDLESVKVRRKVVAPYRENGQPKDWMETSKGNFRMTCPGNFWDDLSVPYWSMPENTDHPTQKPEKLLAKLILASSKPGDLVFDPFLGSGSTAVTAKKLGRHYCGVEMNPEYCCWALARLQRAETDKHIQGYQDGVFWERNSAPQ
ncbi:MAG: site-specific DNA-methyltransferase [Lentisphaeria bacterium]